MDYLNFILPVLLYIFGIILLIVLIILGIRFIQFLDKLDRLVDNVEEKVNSLNGVFSIIDRTTDSIAMLSDTVVNAIARVFSKIFNRKKKEEDYYE